MFLVFYYDLTANPCGFRAKNTRSAMKPQGVFVLMVALFLAVLAVLRFFFIPDFNK